MLTSLFFIPLIGALGLLFVNKDESLMKQITLGTTIVNFFISLILWGKFDNNTLTINQTMVNPFTYTVFFVTAEPVDDPDPKPSDVVVGAKLPIPFGQ